MRRASLLTLRRGSMRRSSLRRTSLVPASTSLDLPWDLLDRLLIPIICCHAAAIILSGALNLFHISDVSCLTLFAWFALSTGGSILFYHHLKVSSIRIFALWLLFTYNIMVFYWAILRRWQFKFAGNSARNRLTVTILPLVLLVFSFPLYYYYHCY